MEDSASMAIRDVLFSERTCVQKNYKENAHGTAKTNRQEAG